MKNPKSKSWFITGVSSGFGRELMLAALERGDTVMGTVRDPEQAKQIEQIAPGRSLAVVLDVTNEQAVQNAVSNAVEEFGNIDVVVNNAGYGLLGAIEETSAKEVKAQFETNVFGALNVLRAVLPHLRRKASGHILNITSIGGLVAYPGWGIYNGSKFALEGISEALRKEVAHLGIKVTAVEPSAFRTNWAGSSLKKAENVLDAYEASSPRGYVSDLNGNQDGDPVRAAQAMLTLIEMPEPPSQLLLGSAALKDAVEKHNHLILQTKAHAELSQSADFQ